MQFDTIYRVYILFGVVVNIDDDMSIDMHGKDTTKSRVRGIRARQTINLVLLLDISLP
ncbi:hypothetical protein Plhal304r1_c015g0056921 [Plasmopara halstedii]